MANEATQAQMDRAREIYATLCKSLDDREWHYEKDEENLVVTCGVSGDDIPMRLIMRVMPRHQLVQVLSPLPFDIPEDKRIDLALALTMVNNRLINGSFDFDLGNGRTVFRLTTAFMDSSLDTEVFDYMVGVTAATVDEYNDKIMMLSKGMIELSAFADE